LLPTYGDQLDLPIAQISSELIDVIDMADCEGFLAREILSLRGDVDFLVVLGVVHIDEPTNEKRYNVKVLIQMDIKEA
jgi:hypothetical protein